MCAASAGAKDGTEKRHRSPAVPFIDLGRAVRRARELYDRVGRDWVTAADAAPAWGLGSKSSASLQTASALLAYGLLESTGKGRARQLRLSDLAGRLLGSPPVSDEEEQRLLTEMALKPKLIAAYAERWLDGRPANATCIGDLTIRHGFTEKAAARFLEVFDAAETDAGYRREGSCHHLSPLAYPARSRCRDNARASQSRTRTAMRGGDRESAFKRKSRVGRGDIRPGGTRHRNGECTRRQHSSRFKLPNI